LHRPFAHFTNAELKWRAQRLTTQLVRAEPHLRAPLYEEIEDLRAEMITRLRDDPDERLRTIR
jgi:hypothetical protein